MNLTILKENLINGLNIVNRATSKSLTLPILNNILFKAEKNFLELAATDLELGVRFWSLAQIKKPGEISIPAKIFNLEITPD